MTPIFRDPTRDEVFARLPVLNTEHAADELLVSFRDPARDESHGSSRPDSPQLPGEAGLDR